MTPPKVIPPEVDVQLALNYEWLTRVIQPSISPHSSPSTCHGRVEWHWFLQALGHPTDAKTIGKKREGSWEKMMRRKKFNEKHFLVPFNGQLGNERSEDGTCSDQYALSIPAT